MHLYIHHFFNLFKKDYMFMLMILVILLFSFFIWAGFPIFVVGVEIAKITSNAIFIHLAICYLCISWIINLFSIYEKIRIIKAILFMERRFDVGAGNMR